MSASSTEHVAQLTDADVPRVVDVLAEAFHHYPVMRFVLGDSADYARRLQALIHFFVMARVLRNEPLFGVRDGATLGAVEIVSYPHGPESPAALGDLREALWRDLGADARARYETCGNVWSAFAMEAPHLHVNMIGVRPAQQGRGLAKRLLNHVHALSADTPDSAGVTLTTEDPANVPFYTHLGYDVVGHAAITPELETWGLLRKEGP